MSNLEIVLTILSAISMLCSIYFGYCAFARNKKQDTKQEATEFKDKPREYEEVEEIEEESTTTPKKSGKKGE